MAIYFATRSGFTMKSFAEAFIPLYRKDDVKKTIEEILLEKQDHLNGYRNFAFLFQQRISSIFLKQRKHPALIR